MNERHLRLCSSAEWAETVERQVIPWTLDAVDLGDDVLEVGPGPGLTTDVLRARARHLTAVEADPRLAADLATRLAGSNVTVVSADATATPLPAETFSGAVCLTMLHHVPGIDRQDALFAEIHRLLRPGALFAGSDSLDSPEFRDLHDDDVCVPVDPGSLPDRLRIAGYVDVQVDTNEYALRFRGRKPNPRQETARPSG